MGVISYQPIFEESDIFKRSAPRVAMVVIVATSQKSHKVRVERSGVTPCGQPDLLA